MKGLWWKLGLLGVGLFVILLAIAAGLGFSLWKSYSAESLEERLATLRAQGAPTDGAQLAAYAKQQGSDHVGQQWIDAAEPLTDSEFQTKFQSLIVDQNAQIFVISDAPQMRELLAENEAIKQLHSLAKAPREPGRLPGEYLPHGEIEMEGYQTLWSAILALQANAQANAEVGDAESCVPSLLALCRLAQLIQSTPYGENVNDQARCIEGVWRACTVLFQRAKMTDSQLAVIQQEVRLLDPKQCYKLGNLQAQTIALFVAEHPEMWQEDVNIYQSDIVAYLDMMQLRRDAVVNSMGPLRMDAIHAKEAEYRGGADFMHTFSNSFLADDFHYVAARISEILSRAAVLDASSAVIRYQLANEKPPESVGDLRDYRESPNGDRIDAYDVQLQPSAERIRVLSQGAGEITWLEVPAEPLTESVTADASTSQSAELAN